MNVLARELAMAFLENRALKLNDSVVTMTEYILSDVTIAKWEGSSLFTFFPKANFKVVRDRINPIFEGYGCGITVEAFQQRLYFIDTTEKQRTMQEVEFEVWYHIRKDGLALKKWQ